MTAKYAVICMDRAHDRMSTMGQHFLKSARLRDFTLFDVCKMTDDEVHEKFIEMRWNDRRHVCCQGCGSIDQHYYRKTRKQWRCKSCDAYFSVTTGTVFQDHKLPLKKILMGIMAFLAGAHGKSLHELCRLIDIQVKTAQVFVGKLREVMFVPPQKAQTLSGLVQIDGGHFGGRPRSARVRRKTKHQITEHVANKIKGNQRAGRTHANWIRLKKRRVVMVVREVYPQSGDGQRKTVTAICMSENENDAVSLAKKYIAPGSTVWSDENAAYNQFSAWYTHETVQHSLEFSTIDGVNDNQAESYFSRLRRCVLGVVNRVEPKYLADLANEISWRTDHCRCTEGEKLRSLMASTFRHGLSKWWRGYWQGFMRADEILWR